MENKMRLEMERRENLLISYEHKIYSETNANNQILYPNISSISPEVVKTLTKDCCLRCGSLVDFKYFPHFM